VKCKPTVIAKMERAIGAPGNRSVRLWPCAFQNNPPHLRAKSKSCCLVATNCLGIEFDRFGRFSARCT
jgi:hypothetical protein